MKLKTLHEDRVYDDRSQDVSEALRDYLEKHGIRIKGGYNIPGSTDLSVPGGPGAPLRKNFAPVTYLLIGSRGSGTPDPRCIMVATWGDGAIEVSVRQTMWSNYTKVLEVSYFEPDSFPRALEAIKSARREIENPESEKPHEA